jgi:pectinesterase
MKDESMFYRSIILFLFSLISGCASFPSSENCNAIVDLTLPESSGNYFSSLSAAIDAAPNNSKKPYRIFIKSGDYYEKIIIAKPNIHLIGESREKTRIYYDAYAGQQSTEAGATQRQIWGTAGSATLIVRAADIQLYTLTLENSFDFARNDALADSDPTRTIHTQAVALHLDNGSDRFVARNINLLGHQDTLFVNAGRSWFDQSLIAGSVEFIFGKGNAVFTQSEIKTRLRGKSVSPYAYLTAPSTSINREYGLTFIDCTLTREPGVPDNSVYLGRPWHPTTQFADGRYADPNAIGKAVFINSWMDAHIASDGWHSMSGTAKDGSKIQFLPQDARFFEFNSSGPGAVINKNRRQLMNKEAKSYMVEKILGNWQPEGL